MSINVAVVDDQDIIRLGVQQSLSAAPHISFTGGFATVEDFCESTGCRKVNVVLLDDSLPHTDVPQAIRMIQECCPETAVLLLGSRLTGRGIHDAIQAGASGVVCKSEPVQDLLILGIQHAHAGKVYLSPGAGLVALNSGSVPVITKSLHDVLVLMAEGDEAPAIALKLGISQKAVYLRCTRLCALLGVKTTKQIIAEAYRRGLLSRDE